MVGCVLFEAYKGQHIRGFGSVSFFSKQLQQSCL